MRCDRPLKKNKTPLNIINIYIKSNHISAHKSEKYSIAVSGKIEILISALEYLKPVKNFVLKGKKKLTEILNETEPEDLN